MIVSNRQYAQIAKLTEEEQVDAAERLWQDKTKNKKPLAQKELIIIVGQPGSGKSTLAQRYLQKNSNLVSIGGDDVLSYHPRLVQMAAIRPPRLNSKNKDCYDDPTFTNPKDDPLDYNGGERYLEDFAHDTYIQTACRLFQEGYSLILDSLPGGETTSFAALGKRLGYKVSFVAAAVPKQMSEQNIVNRFEEGKVRFAKVIKGELPPTSENLPHTYNKMRQAPEDLEFAQRFLEKVAKEYPLQVVNPLNRTVLGTGKEGAKAYLKEISRPLSEAERAFLQERGKELDAKQKERGASKYDRYVLQQCVRAHR